MSPALHTEVFGHGPDLFLIHGWGLHGGIWDGLVPRLSRGWRATCVDMPGHGYSRDMPLPAALQDLARDVVKAAPENAVWIGWSLGGLVALRAALDFPTRVRALILVSSTPRFTRAPDWPCAMSLAQLEKFRLELQRDYRATVQSFLALQVLGSEHAGDTLRHLREVMFSRGEPNPESLAAGLRILCNSDLRSELGRLDLPTLVVTGGHDRLTPPTAGRAMASMIDGAQPVNFPRAAHAPFLSHPREFSETLRSFLDRLPPAVARAWPHERGRSRG